MNGWQRLQWLVDGAWFRRRRLYPCVAAGAAIILTLCLLSPLLGSRWSLIDDHESVRFFDSSTSHGPSWFFHSLMSSEAGSPGSTSRYRPAYYFLRIAETGLFHGSARFWWWSHTAIFASALLLLLWSMRRVTGLWENILVAIWAAGAFAWWGDIYCRLGPSEAYCVPALALYAWGAVSALQTMRSTKLQRYHAWCGAAIGLGGVIAAGGKENMVFLLLPSAYLIVRARWSGSRKWLTIGAAVHIAFGMFVAIATYLGVTRYGHVYKEDVSTGGRLDVMIAAVRRLWGDGYVVVIAALVLSVGAVAFMWRRGRRTTAIALARSLASTAMYLSFVLVVYLSQNAFYNRWPPSLGRYHFPGALCGPLAIYLCYVAAVRAATIAGVDVRAISIVRATAIVFMMWQVAHLDYDTRKAAKLTHDTTLDISRKLHRVEKAAKASPTTPLICVSNSVWDYEAVHAVQVFLQHDHVTNPVYMIQRFDDSKFADKSLEQELARTMASTAKSGGSEGLFPLAKPFAYQGGACIGVGFSGDTGIDDCPATSTF